MQQIFRLLIFLNQPNTFRATNLPILRSTFLTVYTAFRTASAADRCHGRDAEAVHCTKSCIYSQKSAPEDGQICRPKRVGLI